MGTENGYLFSAGLLLMTSAYLLLSVEPVWYSIAGVALTFVAAVASLIRFLHERHRARAVDGRD